MSQEEGPWFLDARTRAALLQESVQQAVRETKLESSLRSEQEQARAAMEALALELLPALDALSQCLKAYAEPEALPPGAFKRLPRQLAAIRAQVEGPLTRRGLASFEAQTDLHDTARVRVVATEVHPGPAGQCLNTLVPGYLWQERVLRVAEVVVSAPEA